MAYLCSKPAILPGLHGDEDIRRLTPEQCRQLCAEIHDEILHTVSENGGHFASNLGVIELTVALHRVFNFPEDKLVFDVGHQCYAHKLLTGRYAQFSTLRKENGLSGFPKPSESPCDAFISGHSSTAISVACGLAQGMRLGGDREHAVIAVVGDGAMTGGLSYEGLNNMGKMEGHMIVILNDNGMSISPNVGGLASWLNSMRGKKGYVDIKKFVERTLEKSRGGKRAAQRIRATKHTMRAVVIKEGNIFENLGFAYYGPINGHNIGELEELLRLAYELNKPVLVHIHTKKGNGYAPAENMPAEYHGVAPFDLEAGNPEIATRDSYSDIFGRELVRIARNDPRICAITAAMVEGTGLKYFQKEFPERFFDVGIAEQHAVTFSAALATTGMVPVFAVYSSFLQRAYDQLQHDAALSGAHIVLGIDRAGVIGEDGETHQGIFDISFLLSVPHTTIYSPTSADELRACLHLAIYQDTGIACVRYPRGCDRTVYNKSSSNAYFTHVRGAGSRQKLLYVGYGRTYDDLYQAARKLRGEGMPCDLLKLTKIFPLEPIALEIARCYDCVVFAEEAYTYGGISELFGCRLLEMGYEGRYRRITIDAPPKQASVQAQLTHLGLNMEPLYADMCRMAQELGLAP